MYARPKGLSAYGKIQHVESNPLAQIVMLYDGAIRFLQQTARAIEENDLAAKAEYSTRALDIVNYLQSILDFERGGDAAPALDRLYASVTVLILRASAELDASLMRRAAETLAPVRDAWETNSRASITVATPEVTAPAAPSLRVAV